MHTVGADSFSSPLHNHVMDRKLVRDSTFLGEFHYIIT